MNTTTIKSAVAGLVMFAFLASTIFSFVAVIGAALSRLPVFLTIPGLMAALALQSAKIGLPPAAFALWRRGDSIPAKAVAGLWLLPFAVCAVAAFLFVTGPHAVQNRSSVDLLARKEAALKSMERARDREELDHEVYKSYAKRIGELRAEIAELRTKPAETISVGAEGLAGQMLGIIAVAVELISALGLLLYRWTIMRDDERVIPAPEPVAPVNVAPAAATPLLPAAPRFVRGSELQFENLQWLWPGLLLANAFSLIGGVGGVGKSTIAASIAAMTTRGGRWPTGEVIEPGAVIYCELEDDLRSVTGPALAAAGADMSRVDLCDEPFDLSQDLSLLTERVEALERDCGLPVRLVVLSPVRQFFGKEVYNDNLVRMKLQLFDDWLKAAPCCGLGVLHPKQNKAAFAGASAWKDKARAGIFAEWIDGKVGGQRRIYPLKTNSGEYGWSLPYAMEGAAPGGFASKRVVWGDVQRGGMEHDTDGGGEDEKEGGAVEMNGVDDTKTGQIAIWLRGMLSRGGLPKTEILELGKGEGYVSSNMIERAADRIGVVKIPKSGRQGRGMWTLPGSQEARDYLASQEGMLAAE